MTTEQRNKELVQAFFSALNKADSAAIVDAYADDGRCVTMGHTLISGSYAYARGKALCGQHTIEKQLRCIRRLIHSASTYATP